MSLIYLSSRERVRLALEYQETDRIPIAMVCSGINQPAYEALNNYLRKNQGIDVEAYLKPLIDIKNVSPVYIGPPLPEGVDIWGVKRKPSSYGVGTYDEIDFYPLANAKSIDDLNKHQWPSTEWFDYSVLPERIAAIQAEGEYCLMISNGNIFETSWYMCGFEQMLMNFILNPDLAHEIMKRVTNFVVEHFSKMLAACKGSVDLAFTADDIGSQEGLLMSFKMWEEHIKPFHIRLNKVIHEFGAKVIYLTCPQKLYQ